MKDKARIELALNEGRMLMLGAEILVGFQYRAPLQEGFADLAPWVRGTSLGGLGLLLCAFALLAAPASCHRLAYDGEVSPDFHRFVVWMIGLALLPFALALGAAVLVGVARAAGETPGALLGAGTAALALLFWYGLSAAHRVRRPPQPRRSAMHQPAEPTSLKERIRQLLIEARIVIPGVQALLGFQLMILFMPAFAGLPASLRVAHLASALLIGLSTILLMTPAAYHCLAQDDQDSEDFYRLSSGLLLAAMAVLGAGMAVDLLLPAYAVSHSQALAIGLAAAAAVLFAVAWFLVPLLVRWRQKG